MTTPRSLLATFAASLAFAAAVLTPAAGATRATPACGHGSAAAGAGCQLVTDFFGALNAGRYERACGMLGRTLRGRTGGARCASILATNRGTPFTIVGAHAMPSGTVVTAKVGMHELDHYRMLTWRVLVGLEAGALKILDTRQI